MRRNLTPLRKKPKKQKFAVCDIEAHRWNQFTVIGHYDGEIFYHFECLDSFFRYIFNRPETIIYAHFGGIYDFLFLLTHTLGSDHFHYESMIPRGSGLLCFSVTDGKRTIQFRDSSALLPHSLKKLTESFNVEHRKKTEFFTEEKWEELNQLEHFPRDLMPVLIDYLEYDCKGLYEVLKKYESYPLVAKAGLKITRSAQALSVFRTYLDRELPACPEAADPIIREAYAGGRTEIYRPFYRSDTRPLYCFDVTSMYPSILSDFDMPREFDCYSYEVDLERIGFGYFTVSVPRDTYLPLLWSRENGKFIFPVGTFSGCWPLCEVKRAVELGATIVSSRAMIYFKSGGKYFADYIDQLFETRRRSTDPVEKLIIKDLLNHLYGRMGLRLEREQLDFDSGQLDVSPHFELQVADKTYRVVKKKIEIHSFSNVAVAAWVTALARIRLYDTLLKPCERTICYTDTDSAYTPEKLEVSDKLGGLKLESESREACFLLPKTYIAGSKIAFKGFENRKVQHFKIEDFEAALSGDLRNMTIQMEARGLNKFKTGLAKGDLLSIKAASEKSIRSRYDKRELFRDNNGQWDSRPIILINGKQCSEQAARMEQTHGTRRQNRKSKSRTNRTGKLSGEAAQNQC